MTEAYDPIALINENNPTSVEIKDGIAIASFVPSFDDSTSLIIPTDIEEAKYFQRLFETELYRLGFEPIVHTTDDAIDISWERLITVPLGIDLKELERIFRSYNEDVTELEDVLEEYTERIKANE